MLNIATRSNPYVGPLAFGREDAPLFFGRDRESEELLALVVSNTIVLFYGQSGAGKTSLICARLIPDLEREGFEVLPVTRVGIEEPNILNANNVYVSNALKYLSSNDSENPSDSAGSSLHEYLSTHAATQKSEEKPRVLILDQFEEILTAHPERWKDREDFFRQLRHVLNEDPLLSVLLAMREDHIAGLDRYANHLPGRLRTRFRIERLRYEAALHAVRLPAKASDRPFAEGVAEELVDNLRQEHLANQNTKIAGEFVEPVQLQVVCLKLWEGLPDRPGKAINRHDLRAAGDVDRALESFYGETLKRVATATGVSELAIYHFCSETLITAAGIRGQVSRGTHKTGGLPNKVIDLLLREHLIRREEIRGGIWYELVHDRFIDPIVRSSQKRRQSTLRNRVVSALAILALAGTIGWIYQSYRQARQESQTLASDALELLKNRPQESLRKALKAVRVTYDSYRTVSVEAESALHQALKTGARLIWDIQHGHAIDSLALSMDGRRLAAAGADGLVKVWDVEAGTTLANLGKQGHKIVRLAFSSDSGRLATVGLDATVKVWDITTSNSLSAFSDLQVPVATVDFDPQGVRLVTAGQDGVVEFWDALSGTPTRSLANPGDAVYHLVFRQDGSRLATVHEDAEIRIWDVDSGTQITTITGPLEGMNAVAFSQTGGQLAIAGLDDTLKVWDLDSKELYRTLPRFVLDATFSSVGDSVIVANNNGAESDHGTANIWHLESSKDALILRDDSRWELAAFSRTGQRLAVAGESHDSGAWSIKLWQYFLDYASSLSGHTHPVWAVDFSPQGTQLATLSVDRTAKLWSVESGREVLDLSGHLGPIEALAFSPDGRQMATAGTDWKISLWDLETWHNMFQITGHSGWIEDIVFSPDGLRLASGSSDGTTKVWNARSGEEICTLRGHSPGTRIWSVAYNPTGESLATTGDEGPPRVWDADTCSEVFSLSGHSAPVRTVVFSPNGKRIVTASDDRTVKVWDATSGEELFTLGQHTQEVRAIAFSPDGQRLVTGGMDREVRLWDTASGKYLFTLPGNNRAIYSLAVGPDGKRLAIAGASSTVRIEFLAIDDLIELAKRRTEMPSTSETEQQGPRLH